MEGAVAFIVLASFGVCLRVTWKLAYRVAYAQGLQDGAQRGYVRALSERELAKDAQEEAEEVAAPVGVPLRVFAQAKVEASRAGFAGKGGAMLAAQRLTWSQRDATER